SPFRTDSARVSPPGTTRISLENRGCSAAARARIGSASSAPAAITIGERAGCRQNAVSVRSRTLCPAISAQILLVGLPNLLARPAAGITTAARRIAVSIGSGSPGIADFPAGVVVKPISLIVSANTGKDHFACYGLKHAGHNDAEGRADKPAAI